MASANRLSCFGARDQGTCENHLTIRRDEVEARVLSALQEKLLRQDTGDLQLQIAVVAGAAANAKRSPDTA